MAGKKIALIMHGGAGSGRPPKAALEMLHEAITSGYEMLARGGAAVDVVVRSLSVLEDSGIFNAGVGANIQLDGVRRLDASLMEGAELRAGSVIGLEGIRNAIQAAAIVMPLPHVIMTDIGARRIAEAEGLPSMPEPSEEALRKLEKARRRRGAVFELYEKYFSTVGAVALDVQGNLASGASTGGVAAMLPGRVGDTPIIGAGVYADNLSAAVSCTGIGEAILRVSVAKELCMRAMSATLEMAAREALHSVRRIRGEAGVIALNRSGQFAIMHTTKYMISGHASEKGVSVERGFHKI